MPFVSHITDDDDGQAIYLVVVNILEKEEIGLGRRYLNNWRNQIEGK